MSNGVRVVCSLRFFSGSNYPSSENMISNGPSAVSYDAPSFISTSDPSIYALSSPTSATNLLHTPSGGFEGGADDDARTTSSNGTAPSFSMMNYAAPHLTVNDLGVPVSRISRIHRAATPEPAHELFAPAIPGQELFADSVEDLSGRGLSAPVFPGSRRTVREADGGVRLAGGPLVLPPAYADY